MNGHNVDADRLASLRPIREVRVQTRMALRLIAQVTVPGGRPRGITFDGQRVWVASESPSVLRVLRADQSELGEPQFSFRTGKPRGIAWDSGRRSFWLADAELRILVELDPRSGAERSRLPLPEIEYPAGLTLAQGRFWQADFERGVIVGLTYPTGEESHRWVVSHGLCGLEWADGNLWVAEQDGSSLLCVSGKDGHILRKEMLPDPIRGHRYTGLTWDGRAFWLGDETKGVGAVHSVRLDA